MRSRSRARAPDRPHIRRCIESLVDRFEPVDYDVEIAPGVARGPRARPLSGAHGDPSRSEGQEAVLLGDVAAHPALLDRPDWVFAFDEDAARERADAARAPERGRRPRRPRRVRPLSGLRHRSRRHARRQSRVGRGGDGASRRCRLHRPEAMAKPLSSAAAASRRHLVVAGRRPRPRRGARDLRRAAKQPRKAARSRDLAARRREARARTSLDGRAWARRARRPRARQRPLPHELLGR